MSDEPDPSATGAQQPDYSALQVPLAPKRWQPSKNPRPLHGISASVWFPVLVLVTLLQLTLGVAFVVLPPLAIQEWTWIISPYMCIYSIVPAQFCLLHLPLVLGPGAMWRRLSVYWTTAIALLASWYVMLIFAGWIAGSIQAGEPNIVRYFTEMAFWLPPFLVTLQLPLWLVRWFGKRALHNPRVSAPQRVESARSSFTAQGLQMIALLGLTIGGYYSLWSLNPPEAESQYVEQTIAMGWRTAAIALALVPPTVYWLRSGEVSELVAWVVTAIYTTFAVTVACWFLWVVYDIGSFDGGGLTIIATMTLGFATSYTGGLHLLRHYGWRLVRQ